MRQVMVRYRVKPERVAENEQLVRAVYDELKDVDPDRFQYATFRLDDGVTFVHEDAPDHSSCDGAHDAAPTNARKESSRS